MIVSTIGEKMKYNPRLRGKSQVEYVTLINQLNGPRPKMMDSAVPLNRNCGNLDG